MNYKKISIWHSIFFIVVCLLFCGTYFMGDWQPYTATGDTLRQISAYLAFFIRYILIPAGVIIGILIYVLHRKAEGKEARKPIYMCFYAICLASLLLCGLVHSYYSGRTATSGSVQNVEKHEADGGYYITLNNTDIEVSRRLYESLDDDTDYLYVYYHGDWLFGRYVKLGSIIPRE